ncbi:UPF0175 family protein [Candidatus Desantisbacteria bacterium]|nr:UPF0175 family protein [Candidatus Desantisbacteria bacterium]
MSVAVKTIGLTISEEIFLVLNEKQDDFLKDIKIFADIKFFEMGKLSLGKAAMLAEMNKADFIELLSRHRISVYNYAPEELNEDLSSIQRAREN